jgi:hypothetical protein
MLTSMLKDRLIEFSESKKEEWGLIRSKIGDGVELPLPDTGRWFLATIDGDNIKIEGGRLNVRALLLHNPEIITFEDFCSVADTYTDILRGGIQVMDSKLNLQKNLTSFKFIFMLIYNFV